MKNTCSNENCQLDACWQPVFEVRSTKRGPVTTVKLTEILCCDMHKENSTLATFLSDEGFTKIIKHMREHGKKPPVQRNTTLTWLKLSPEVLETMKQAIPLAEPNPDEDLAF